MVKRNARYEVDSHSNLNGWQTEDYVETCEFGNRRVALAYAKAATKRGFVKIVVRDMGDWRRPRNVLFSFTKEA